MRPQQNRRMRGRGSNNNPNNNNNNNRKGPNPLTRSYESNGPDVKIRGTAQQIAEKYTTLARDAQSSGDRVMAENYLQHAEHYNRIIAAAQAQMPSQPEQQQQRDRSDDDDFDGDDRETQQGDGGGQREAPQQSRGDGGNQRVNGHRGSGPQPVIDGTPAEVALRQGNLGQRNDGEQGDDRSSRPQAEDSQQPAADASPDGEQGDDQPRRARRPRRPRRAPEGEAAGEPRSEEVVPQD
jgi:hypothetical protein